MSLIPTRRLSTAFKRRRKRCRATRRKRMLVEQLERRTLFAGINIALSATEIQENPANGSNAVTITAMADSPVVGDQSVDVIVSGTGITPGDFILSNATIVIPDGQTTGTATFTSVNDSEFEIRETALLELTNLSAGLTAGSNLTGSIDIRDTTTSDLAMINLLEIANALPTTNWANQGDEPCAWTGALCNANRVVDLSFDNPDATFSGPIPRFNDLRDLLSLQLRFFNFTGPPPDLDSLPAIRIIRFDGSQFTGTLADLFAGDLNDNVSFINVAETNLSGPVPVGFLTGNPEVSVVLERNRLSGTLPESTAVVRRLSIAGNMLEGAIPSYGVPSPVFDVDYNMFDVVNTPPIPGADESWRNTQTVPPTNASGTSPSDGTAEITWTPIAYQADGGYYEVLSSTTPGGPYISRGTTAASGAKTASSLTLTGQPGGTQYFVVRTFTPKHVENPNDLTSVLGTEFVIDLGPLTVGLSASDAIASEIGGDTGTFQLTRDNPNGPLTVNLSFNAASTVDAAEFELAIGSNPPINVTGPSFSVTFPDGSDTLDLTLTALADSTDAAELAETITLDLLPGGYFVDGTSNTGIVTIAQNGFLVTTDTDGGTGSLRQAVLNANALSGPDTITFDPSLGGGTITLESTLPVLTSNIVVDGPGSAELTVRRDLANPNKFRLMQVDPGATVELKGLTLTGGRVVSIDTGGAIRNLGTLTVTASTLAGNTAGSGGAIINDGVLFVTGSTLSGNSDSAGGGGAIRNRGTTTVTASTFTDNSSAGGGAILNEATLTLISSTLVGNSANAGGGIQLTAGTLNIINSIVAGNTVGGANNDLQQFAGGTLVSNGNNFVGVPGNLTLAPTDKTFANTGTTITGLLETTLADNGGPTQTLALLPGSPAIDAGDPAAVAGVGNTPLFDQRGTGFDRVRAGRVDIGAFELQNQSPLFTSSTTTEVAENTTVVHTLTATDADLPAQTVGFSILGVAPVGDLGPGQTLAVNQSIQSPDGSRTLLFQSDGNFVVYGPGGVVTWASGINGPGADSVTIESNGNLVIRNGAATLYQTNSASDPNSLARLRLTNAGQPVIFRVDGAKLWEATLGSSAGAGTIFTPGALDSSFTAAADNNQFEVVGGALQFKTSPDFENPTDLGGTAGDNVYEVSVLADDGNGGVTPQTIQVTVTDIDEIAPTADIVDVTPDPRNTSVGNVTVNFNEAVTNVDITDFVLTRNGQVVNISGLTVSQNTPQQYEIDLSTVTGTDGDYLLRLSQGSDIADTAGNGLSNAAIDQFMIDTVGPQVESVVVNGGDAQRSTVSEITVNFSEIVSVDANSFILMNTTTSTQVVPTVTTQIIGGKSVAKLTFSGVGIIGGSLADGDYTLRTLDSISDSAGNSLDGDKNGSAGGDATDDFYRFFGDINGDRVVNIVDFFQFRNAFSGGPYNAAFDYNGDGMINIADFFQFRSRFGSSL